MEEAAPKKRGRPAGSKNKATVEIQEEEAPESIEPPAPESIEPSESQEVPPESHYPDPEPQAVKMKKPRAPRPQAPRPQAPAQAQAPAPTAQEIAHEMLYAMDTRHYDRLVARRALYQSWV